MKSEGKEFKTKMKYNYNPLYNMYIGSDGHMYYPHEIPDSKRKFKEEMKGK